MIANPLRTAKRLVYLLSHLLVLVTSQVAWGQTPATIDTADPAQWTVEVDGAGLEPGFPAKLKTLGIAALEHAAEAWQQSVAIPERWELQNVRFVLVRQLDGFDVSLAAEVMVRYLDVVLNPSATGEAELVSLEHDAYTFEDVHAYFVGECDRVANTSNPPRGQRIVSELVGEPTHSILNGYLYPFKWARYTQGCAVRRSNLPGCLELANHPQNCQYAPRIRQLSLHQNVSCRLADAAYTCVQTQPDPYLADMSPAILSLVADDNEGV